MIDLILILLAGVGVGIFIVISLHTLVRWKARRLVGKEITDFGKNIILYFYSPGCKACMKMEPVMKSVAKKTRVRKIDISDKEGLRTARKLGVWGTPTTVIVKDGKVKSVFVGYRSEEKILREVGK